MGEAAERMARRNEVGRAEQDAFALRSHQRAAAAIAGGVFDDEVVEVTTPEGKTVRADGLVRGDTSLEKLAKLRAAFAKDGTLTASSSNYRRPAPIRRRAGAWMRRISTRRLSTCR